MKPKNQQTPAILITIDVEDWFQVENFKSYIPFSTWNSRELRVEQNVHRLLDLFDSIKLDPEPTLNLAGSQMSERSKTELINNNYSNSATKHTGSPAIDNLKIKDKNSKLSNRIKTTFFVLGWLAKRLPDMVREIGERGHEVASHGYNHNLCSTINKSDLKKELIKSKTLLEDITGSEVYGFRAPSFSIDNDILNVIEECGYQYDSSYNSFSIHSRYGKVNLNGHPKQGIVIKLSDNFYELPISNLKILPREIHDSDSETGLNVTKFEIEMPWGGGGYFRIIPSVVFNYGVDKILKRNGAYLFYMHPWEIDPYQPRVSQAKLSYRFRHYTNLSKMPKKISSLVKNFSNCNFISCTEYLKEGIRQNDQ